MPIIIKSSVNGFRRAGMAHPSELVTHPDGTFTKAQLKQLENEPRLSVKIIEGAAIDDSSNSNSNSKGPMDEERLRELVAHIASLDKDDASLWKQDNSPKATAFSKDVTAEERTQAWEAYLATLDNSSSEDAPKDENSGGEK
ncbi:hypothetical protein TW85_25130 [Marinomonas sp. S3726]|uniref:HI1506-related protein n=1 Tax=Marinomonas sp. S3726 TaxID=579484 RepID=UPI00061F2C8E|nr:HI1506-related protein [Marinomonas sp. S3726]KJZ06126.1 hypothetical protein TW85_25130 [Marinomonas sp. S3726]